MHTKAVLEYLKQFGQLLDSQISEATGIALDAVQVSLKELSAHGDISTCRVTTYVKGKPVDGFQCRVSGYFPRPAPGRKPAAK